MRWNAVKKIFAAYFLHLFAVNAVNCGELFFSPRSRWRWIILFPRSMRLIFFSPHLAVKKNNSPLERNWWKKIIRRIKRWKKLINRHRECGEKNNSPRFTAFTAFTAKRCKKYALKFIFFSPHFTAFLTKIHLVFYEFPLLNISYLNQRFSWFFCQTRHHQAAHCRQSPSATIFHCSATFNNFCRFFKSFKQNR